MLERTTHSAAETEAFGGALAALLVPGDVILVRGEIGAGKTTLVRGVCRALGVDGPRRARPSRSVTSTQGTATVAHLDLYRFVAASPAEWGDLEPYFDGTIAFVEWPEAGAAVLPPARAEVLLEHRGPSERRIRADSTDGTLLEDLARADPGVRYRN